MKKLWLWYLLLTKRLLKKPSFWAVLLLAPLLTAGLTLLSKEEAHILQIAVYAEESADPLGGQIIRELQDIQGVIQYISCGSEAELRRKVAYSQVDAGYLLPADLTDQIQDYVSGQHTHLPYHGHLIAFITNEDTTQLQLAREQFYGVLYPYLSKTIAEEFTLEQPGASQLNPVYVKKAVDRLYEEMHVEESIFDFSYSKEDPSQQETHSYLLAPLRGMLSLFVFLTGLSSALYLLKDKKTGLFAWVRYDVCVFYDWIYIFSGTAIGGLAAYSGLLLSGTFTQWSVEFVTMLLLVFSVTGFCGILSQIIKSISVFGTCIPLLLLTSAALCPIFASVPGLQPIKYLLPPYFYLHGLHNGRFRFYLLAYGIFINLFYVFLYRVSEKLYIKRMGNLKK